MNLIANDTIVRGKPGEQETIAAGDEFAESNAEEVKALIRCGAARKPDEKPKPKAKAK